MKALVRIKNKEIAFKSVPEVFIKNDDDIKIALKYSSFCRDDMRFDDDSDIFAHIGILGHEGVGEVVEVGKEAFYNGFREGDRVFLIPWNFCGECENCLEQNIQHCLEAYIAVGTMAQYVIRKYTHLIKIPNNMTYKQAVIIEPLACVLDAIDKINITFSKEILVIGSGFIGLMFIQLLKRKGVKSITVIEPIVNRQKLALKYGADHIIDLSDKNFQLKLSKITNFRGFDIAIETSSNINMINEGINALTKGATMIIFTYYGSGEQITFSALDMYVSNLSIIWSCFCSYTSFYKAIDLILQGKVDDFITEEHDFENVLDVIEKLKTYESIKIGIKNFKN